MMPPTNMYEIFLRYLFKIFIKHISLKDAAPKHNKACLLNTVMVPILQNTQQNTRQRQKDLYFVKIASAYHRLDASTVRQTNKSQL